MPRKHRWAAAALLEADEGYLWPSVLQDVRTAAASGAELVTLYPNRGLVPWELLETLLSESEEAIDILVFAGLFLVDTHPGLAGTLAVKARSGVRVRVIMGDPDSDAVRLRGDEEGIGGDLAARSRLSLNYLREAIEAPGLEIRPARDDPL